MPLDVNYVNYEEHRGNCLCPPDPNCCSPCATPFWTLAVGTEGSHGWPWLPCASHWQRNYKKGLVTHLWRKLFFEKPLF